MDQLFVPAAPLLQLPPAFHPVMRTPTRPKTFLTSRPLSTKLLSRPTRTGCQCTRHMNSQYRHHHLPTRPASISTGGRLSRAQPRQPEGSQTHRGEQTVTFSLDLAVRRQEFLAGGRIRAPLYLEERHFVPAYHSPPYLPITSFAKANINVSRSLHRQSNWTSPLPFNMLHRNVNVLCHDPSITLSSALSPPRRREVRAIAASLYPSVLRIIYFFLLPS